MNREEFNEMKQEFGEYVYNYEFFQKSGVLYDMYYTHYYGDILEKLQRLEIENIVLDEAMKLALKGEPRENISSYLDITKNRYQKDIVNFKNKRKRAEEIYAHNEKMSKEDKDQFEKDYLDFCINVHPVVKCLANDEEHKSFMVLRNFYFENNYDAFKEFLADHKKKFKKVEYKEEEFNRISGYYYENKTRINKDFSQRNANYPYTKKDVFVDEISIAREDGELHARLTEYQRQNQDLHKAYKEVFTNDFSID